MPPLCELATLHLLIQNASMNQWSDKSSKQRMHVDIHRYECHYIHYNIKINRRCTMDESSSGGNAVIGDGPSMAALLARWGSRPIDRRAFAAFAAF
jgi:hypothetical protein